MIYRKQGATERWENGTLIRVTECGVAIEEGDYFECRPDVGRASARPLRGRRAEARPTLLHDIKFERLIITHGVADHECEDRTWREETDRIHASLVHDKLRGLVDSTSERLDDVFTIANALPRAEQERPAPKHLRIEPNVTAALLPHFVNRPPKNVRIVQTAGGIDGYGNPIVEANADWPNAYRPSYRVRPVRMPHNLRIECDDTQIDEDAPRAIALLAPVSNRLRVLVVDRQRVYPTTVTIARIRAVATDRIWYPYGAGSFGAAMML